MCTYFQINKTCLLTCFAQTYAYNCDQVWLLCIAVILLNCCSPLISTSGAFPVLSLMVGAVVTRLVPDEGPPANITGFEGLTMDQQRALVSASLTFLVGIFQVCMHKLTYDTQSAQPMQACIFHILSHLFHSISQ